MKIIILDVGVDNVTFDQTLAKIEQFVATGKPHQVVTVNPEFVMRAQTDLEFRKVINNADLAVPDGVGLLWASRVINSRSKSNPKTPIISQRVTGTDLLPAIAKAAALKGWKLFLLGGDPGNAKQTSEKLSREIHGLNIVGAECGPRINEDGLPINDNQQALLDETIERIAEAKPDVLFVGFGAPKQDRFIARYQSRLKCLIMIGVGGAFEFMAGTVRRAPKLFRLLWLEWLWRLFTEPQRASRIYTAAIKFPLTVLFKR